VVVIVQAALLDRAIVRADGSEHVEVDGITTPGEIQTAEMGEFGPINVHDRRRAPRLLEAHLTRIRGARTFDPDRAVQQADLGTPVHVVARRYRSPEVLIRQL